MFSPRSRSARETARTMPGLSMASHVMTHGMLCARRCSSGLFVSRVVTSRPVAVRSAAWSRATPAISSGEPETSIMTPNSPPRTAIRLSSMFPPRSVT